MRKTAKEERIENALGVVGIIVGGSALAYLLIKRLAQGTVYATNQYNGSTMEHKSVYGNTRGYRNNNPLNIRISNNAWKGKIPVEQNTDGSFEQFQTMAYGFRAGMKNIKTIVNRGYNTLTKLINIWAPASDGNVPTRYVQRIVNTFPDTFTADTIINPNNQDMMEKLVYAMAIVENGTSPQWDDIIQAWKIL